jgi:hypothetical protein
MSDVESDKNWTRTLDIPASAIVFAAGASLIGTAVGGTAGGVIGALVGMAGGVLTELASQKIHRRESAKKSSGE